MFTALDGERSVSPSTSVPPPSPTTCGIFSPGYINGGKWYSPRYKFNNITRQTPKAAMIEVSNSHLYLGEITIKSTVTV
jgi:hypothetical protein